MTCIYTTGTKHIDATETVEQVDVIINAFDKHLIGVNKSLDEYEKLSKTEKFLNSTHQEKEHFEHLLTYAKERKHVIQIQDIVENQERKQS